MQLMVRVAFLFFAFAVVWVVVIAIARLIIGVQWSWSIVLGPLIVAWLFQFGVFLWLGVESLIRGADAK